MVTNDRHCAGAKRLKHWPRCIDEKILKKAEYNLLSEGYLFLRRLDHRLRLERDQSIDSFEADPGRLEGIARALGYGEVKKKNLRTHSRSGTKLLRDYQSRREKNPCLL